MIFAPAQSVPTRRFPRPPARRAARRRGIAPLEMVMCLPILLLLIIGLLGVGIYSIRQGEATIVARQKTWRTRWERNAGGKPFSFRSSKFLSERVSADLNVSPMLDSWASPASRHSVLGGTWDHRQLPMNRPPHYSTYRDVALAAAENAALQGVYNVSQQLDAWMQQINQAAAVLDKLGTLQQEATDFLTNYFQTYRDEAQKKLDEAYEALERLTNPDKWFN